MFFDIETASLESMLVTLHSLNTQTHTHTYTPRQTDRHTDRHTHTQTDRQLQKNGCACGK